MSDTACPSWQRALPREGASIRRPKRSQGMRPSSERRNWPREFLSTPLDDVERILGVEGARLQVGVRARRRVGLRETALGAVRGASCAVLKTKLGVVERHIVRSGVLGQLRIRRKLERLWAPWCDVKDLPRRGGRHGRKSAWPCVMVASSGDGEAAVGHERERAHTGRSSSAVVRRAGGRRRSWRTRRDPSLFRLGPRMGSRMTASDSSSSDATVGDEARARVSEAAHRGRVARDRPWLSDSYAVVVR